MISQIPCKQSIRIEKSSWFKHYFPGNLRRNFLFKVCNYTSYEFLHYYLTLIDSGMQFIFRNFNDNYKTLI